MSDEGPSEKKAKMERVVVDSPLAPPAIGMTNYLHPLQLTSRYVLQKPPLLYSMGFSVCLDPLAEEG